MTTILIIEDLEPVRSLFSNFFDRGGYNVLAAATGIHGLDLCGQIRPDIVLLDIQLPDMLGYEVCRRLKADSRTTAVPILLMTSIYVEIADRVAGLLAGAEDIITHPCPLKQIADTVAGVLAGTHRLTSKLDRAVVLEREKRLLDAAELYGEILRSSPGSTVTRLCEEGLRRIVKETGRLIASGSNSLSQETVDQISKEARKAIA